MRASDPQILCETDFRRDRPEPAIWWTLFAANTQDIRPATCRTGKTLQQDAVSSRHPAYSRAIRNRSAQHLRGYGSRPGFPTDVSAYGQPFRNEKRQDRTNAHFDRQATGFGCR